MSRQQINRRIYNDGEYGTEFRDDPGATIRTLAAEPTALLISVNGACENKGLPNARAAGGIFWAGTSNLNMSMALPASLPQTVRAAKLFALERALDMIIENLLKPWFELPKDMSRIVIIVDSLYVKSGVDGYKEADGKPVVNGELFKKIHQHFEHLQSRGYEVNIWDVPKEQNTDAEKLARAGL
ncbi:putative Ribonuclease H [Glarea lozoyensis 74030]|uniref:Putative Ribonuclease H n=1 Tax=Glarea lozoyensis (strain ATCC 74030 / MF5533) TaxID=1104152 RepID=H0EMK7_GLAL7|nr:putative Ribonuclease H [Glarea lozoyensis 74030]